MKEDSMLKCLIAFVLGLLFARMTTNRNRFTVGGGFWDFDWFHGSTGGGCNRDDKSGHSGCS